MQVRAIYSLPHTCELCYEQIGSAFAKSESLHRTGESISEETPFLNQAMMKLKIQVGLNDKERLCAEDSDLCRT